MNKVVKFKQIAIIDITKCSGKYIFMLGWAPSVKVPPPRLYGLRSVSCEISPDELGETILELLEVSTQLMEGRQTNFELVDAATLVHPASISSVYKDGNVTVYISEYLYEGERKFQRFFDIAASRKVGSKNLLKEVGEEIRFDALPPSNVIGSSVLAMFKRFD